MVRRMSSLSDADASSTSSEGPVEEEEVQGGGGGGSGFESTPATPANNADRDWVSICSEKVSAGAKCSDYFTQSSNACTAH